MNRYCRPESADLRSIDSMLLICPPGSSPLSPILLMFKIVEDEKECDVNEGNLRRTDHLGLLKGTRRYCVVVTPEGFRPEIKIPRMEGGRRLSGDGFQVFNYPVRLGEVFPGH